jgi:hypothetical protein
VFLALARYLKSDQDWKSAAEKTKKILVEAAGVEPASENVTSKENYMLIQFMLPAFTGNVRWTRSELTRNADS